MIPKSFVQDLLGRVDVADVIETYVPLKRAGANLVACCPFHSEKSPSFTVSPSKQFYHCFGCGAHGSAIGFLMEYSGLTYVEAVKELAQRAGMTVPEVHADSKGEFNAGRGEGTAALEEVMHRAAAFYKVELKRSERAIGYLKGRGLTGAIAARFGLGYAPAGWQSLADVFADYGAQGLVDAGLVIRSEEGKRYDRFRDRVMFPIVSQRGQVIGFGGRVLEAGEPKYLNSPETPLFEKGRELYGLFQARQGIRAAGRALVVEGYMDVVALAQFGVGYAVATLGTATTPMQVQKLFRQTDEVVFCFDGDAAGRRAAWRALENTLEQLQDGKQVKFMFLPPEHDPDSFVREHGRERFESAVAEAVPLSSFALRELSARVDMGSPEGRTRFLQDVKPLVNRIAAPILGVMLRKRVAELAGMEQGELEQRLGLAPMARKSDAPARTPRRGADPYARLLERLLAAPALLAEVRDAKMSAPLQPSAEARALFILVQAAAELEGEIGVAAAIELLRAADCDVALQPVLKAVDDLQRWNFEELRSEVRDLIVQIQTRQVSEEARRTLAGVRSPGELDNEARERLTRALALGKSVKTD
ncbi:MAG: DNA primase [Burkholderiales bacterium]|nr:DNA primase [Burkholderiales bacterium]